MCACLIPLILVVGNKLKTGDVNQCHVLFLVLFDILDPWVMQGDHNLSQVNYTVKLL